MTTDAPSRASARAIANPIPAVDPVTRVFFPSNCKFIGRSFLYSFRAYRETKNSQARLWPARLHKNRWRSDRVHDFKRPDRRLDDSLLGLVLMERCFDGRFQSRSAKWLEHITKGADSDCALHRSVISMRGEKDDRHMEVAADSDCANDAIDSSSEGDVHKNQIRLV